MSVKITGFDAIKANLIKAVEQTKLSNEIQMQDLADRMYEIARANAPVRTGTLRDAIEKKIDKDGDKTTVGLTVNESKAPYAKFVINGTSRIKPNNFLELAEQEAKNHSPK